MLPAAMLGVHYEGTSKHPLGPQKEQGVAEGSRRLRRGSCFVKGVGGSPAVEWIVRRKGSSSMEKRAFGSARRTIRAVFVHSAVNGGRRHPARSLPMRARKCAMGLGESVVRVPPGRTGCIVLRREGTFRIRRLQHFGSRHRALSSRWRELGGKGRRGTLDALLYGLGS